MELALVSGLESQFEGERHVSTGPSAEDQREADLRAQLAVAVKARDKAEARRIRDELTELDLRRRGREIGASLPPPTREQIETIAEIFGAVVVPRDHWEKADTSGRETDQTGE